MCGGGATERKCQMQGAEEKKNKKMASASRERHNRERGREGGKGEEEERGVPSVGSVVSFGPSSQLTERTKQPRPPASRKTKEANGILHIIASCKLCR